MFPIVKQKYSIKLWGHGGKGGLKFRFNGDMHISCVLNVDFLIIAKDSFSNKIGYSPLHQPFPRSITGCPHRSEQRRSWNTSRPFLLCPIEGSL